MPHYELQGVVSLRERQAHYTHGLDMLTRSITILVVRTTREKKGQEMSNTERRDALADFLRTRRARLSPEELGLPLWGRRRTPGLRREEVAALAGIGITWYTWLEQGRPITVSVELLERLSQILRLNADERLHLFTLAGQSLPAQVAQPDFYVRPVLQSLLEALDPCPAHIRNSRWDVLAWNSAESMVTDWEGQPVAERNALLNHFCNPRMRQILPKWKEDGKMMIALFRLEYARYAHIAAFQELVEQLQGSSKEFRQWWSEHEVQSQRLEPMEFEHPELGQMVLDRLTVIVQQEPLLVMRALLPPSAADKGHMFTAMAAARSASD